MPLSDSKKQILRLPSSRQSHWKESLSSVINQMQPGKIDLDCKDWYLCCRDLRQLETLIRKADLQIDRIISEVPETLVSGSSLGHKTYLYIPPKEVKKTNHQNEQDNLKSQENKKLLFHQGTLRSGENLDSEGDILLLGDVNPGARISAGGDVMIWGRLRGIAHAGKFGNLKAKIIALELRPLQLRIADQIARGPEGTPEQGLAEEAKIKGNRIIINPATTKSQTALKSEHS